MNISDAGACGAGSAVFLLLRECTVLCVLPHARYCVWGSLYLDHHGEEDQNLRRGKMLFLNAPRLAQLTQLVLDASFCHNARILAGVQRNPAGETY